MCLANAGCAAEISGIRWLSSILDPCRRRHQSDGDLPRRTNPGPRISPALLIALATFAVPPDMGLVQAAPQIDTDSAILQADEAREDADQQAIHLSGGVKIHATDWEIAADTASLYGDLEDPRLIVGEGTPARLRIIRSDDEDNIEAEGRHIEYRRAEELIRITDRAVLILGRRTLRGSALEYAIRTQRLTSTGRERIRVKSLPDP